MGPTKIPHRDPVSAKPMPIHRPDSLNGPRRGVFGKTCWSGTGASRVPRHPRLAFHDAKNRTTSCTGAAKDPASPPGLLKHTQSLFDGTRSVPGPPPTRNQTLRACRSHRGGPDALQPPRWIVKPGRKASRQDTVFFQKPKSSTRANHHFNKPSTLHSPAKHVVTQEKHPTSNPLGRRKASEDFAHRCFPTKHAT